VAADGRLRVSPIVPACRPHKYQKRPTRVAKETYYMRTFESLPALHQAPWRNPDDGHLGVCCGLCLPDIFGDAHVDACDRDPRLRESRV